MALTGKTIGELALLGTITSDTLFPVESSGSTFHIPYSGLSIGGGSTYEEVTYEELYSMYTGSTLIPGKYYLITNFQTCYDRPDYDQNITPIVVSPSSYFQGPTQTIVVLATSIDTLAIDAYQPAYPNDKIKYDINYSTTESGGVAFGRITERIDEYGNRTDYDFRTIEFKRYKFYYYSKETPQTGTIEILNDGTVNGTATFFTSYSPGQVIAFPTSNEVFFRIVSISSDKLMTVSGQTINTVGGSYSFYLANSSGNYDSYYMSNVDDPTDFSLFFTFDSANSLNNYIGDYSIHHLEDNLGDFLLANNVFVVGEFNNNKIGNGSYNNTFNDDCTNNTIANYFYNNITDDDFDGNVIGNYFSNNRITANFQYNQIGENFEFNQIYNSDFYRNQIGNDFNSNWFDSDWGFDFQNNQIGNQFYNNTFFRDFIKNIILNGYNNNQIFQDFIGNDIGNGFNDNEIYQNFFDNRIKDYFENNTIGDVNNIGNGVFGQNVIGNYFNNNTTNGAFNLNRIGENFANNPSIGNNFESNTIGNYFINNVPIGDNFNNNMIGNGFDSNNVSSGFTLNDIKVSISTTDFTSATHVYGDYNCEIFKRSGDGTLRLSYYDSSDVLNITNITA